MKKVFSLLVRTTDLCLAFFLLCMIISAVKRPGKKPELKNGIWRSVLVRPDGKQIVFNMLAKDSAGKKIFYVLNAGEKLLVDSVRMVNDSVYIQMPFFESEFRARITGEGRLEGSWVKRLADKDQEMPFNAVYGQQRFTENKRPVQNVTGRWAVRFFPGANHVTNAVGEFTQKGPRLTGTFLTSTGDYRYLEGVAYGDSLKLSGFDGGHAFLFTARMASDSVITGGQFYSGLTGVESWTAVKDSKAALPDGYGETFMRPGEDRLNFRFKSIDGKMVSVRDEFYKGKVVVVQIMGSWCPNCMDETAFLSPYYNANRQKGVEMIALAYERSTDEERSKRSLQSFQRRFNVQYPILNTGVTVNDTLRAQKTLPELTTIKGFPTSIFIDKKGVVRKIYTGFTGPGTGEYYEQFKKEFEATMTELLSEKP